MNTCLMDIKDISSSGLNALRLSRPKHFSVEKIFDCGQSFRFEKVEGSKHDAEYAGMAFGKYISVAEDKEHIYLYNVDRCEYHDRIERFLALDRDYDEINRDILSRSDNENLKEAMDVADGIRILHQDPWEALCSFIISQNNNIPRIKKIVGALSFACDDIKSVAPENMKGHISGAHNESNGGFSPFPSPERVALLGVDGLTDIKTGFRAKYIYDACVRVQNGHTSIYEYENIDTESAAAMLQEIKGVGPKVAACALLYGCGHLDAFPIDVWIKRVIAKYFGNELDAHTLGMYAGVAQQYLFYYERYING